MLTKEKPEGFEIREVEKTFELKADVIKLLKVRDFLILCAVIFVGMGAFNGISTWIEKILGEHGYPHL